MNAGSNELTATGESTITNVPKVGFFNFLRRRKAPRNAPASIQQLSLKQDLRTPRGLSFGQPAASREMQLWLYVFEILGFTFGVDFDELNRAWCTKLTTLPTTSILCTEERNNLLHLSRYINELLEHQLRNALSTGSRALKEEVYNTIVVRGSSWDTSSYAYSLDLLATYAHQQCNPSSWDHTLIGYWSGYHRTHEYRAWGRYLERPCTSHCRHVTERGGTGSGRKSVGAVSGREEAEGWEGDFELFTDQGGGQNSGGCAENPCKEDVRAWWVVVMTTRSDTRYSGPFVHACFSSSLSLQTHHHSQAASAMP
jgi:hypothetical protein